jgi:hypothetical protein
MVCNPPFRGSIKKVGAFSALGGGFLRWATSTMRRDELLAKMQDNECFNLVDYPLCFSGPARMRTVDETKPYIWIEPTRPPADSSREFGDTAAIHLVVPNVSRVDVPMTRTERNAVAFDYFCKKFKDGINV